MEELSEVRALGNTGFEGCAHGATGAHGKFCWWIAKLWKP